jgi:hypothetical protein
MFSELTTKSKIILVLIMLILAMLTFNNIKGSSTNNKNTPKERYVVSEEGEIWTDKESNPHDTSLYRDSSGKLIMESDGKMYYGSGGDWVPCRRR